MIKSEYARCQKFYSNIKEGLINEIDVTEIDSQYNFKLMQKEYKKIFFSHNNIKTEPSRIKEILKRLEEFKETRSRLEAKHKLENQDLMLDNRIANFLEKYRDSQHVEIYLETFILKETNKLYEEIFKKRQDNLN
jgi:hypothetical protein